MHIQFNKSQITFKDYNELMWDETISFIDETDDYVIINANVKSNEDIVLLLLTYGGVVIYESPDQNVSYKNLDQTNSYKKII